MHGAMTTSRRLPSLLMPLVFTWACGDSPGSDGSGGDSAGGTTETVCLDSSGKSPADCAVEPKETLCDAGDANDCGEVVGQEVWADDGTSGACLILSIQNTCEGTLYSITCIDHEEESGVEQQCWWSTTLPGGIIDVSQCHATGDYGFVASLSSGKLDVYSEKCGF